MSKVNKDTLIEKISKRTNVQRKEVEDILVGMQDVIIDELKAGNEVVLTGFGSFLARTREARMGVNPQKPSERIKIPTVIVPKFKAGKTLKDELKSSGSNEEKEEEQEE